MTEDLSTLIAVDLVPEDVRADLADIAVKVRESHNSAKNSFLVVGHLLEEARKRMAKHGNGTFTAWVESDCGLSIRTARNYMYAAARYGDEDSATVAESLEPAAMYILAAPSCPAEAQIEAESIAKAGGTVTAKLAKELVQKHKRVEETEPVVVDGVRAVDSLAMLVAEGAKFGSIYADPPWQYGNQATRASTDNHYSTMTLDAIAALPVGELAAERSHLWLWTTNGFLRDSFTLFDAWGFEFKSSYIWVKPQIGIGNYLRNSHEFLLLGVRGGLTAEARNVRSWGEYDRTAHSAKPEAIRRNVVERISPGPRLELFGRRLATGWTVFGNQIERTMFDTEVA